MWSLLPVWIHNGHAAQPWQALIRRFVHSDALPAKLVEPGSTSGTYRWDQAACRAIARVLSQKERQSVAGHLRERPESQD